MDLKLIGHDDRYAIEQLQMALFPQGSEGCAQSRLHRSNTWLTAVTVIEKDGEEYILERTASSRTGVFSSESAKSASVGGNIAISDLVGISREVFERSFFISGSSLAVTGAGELEKKIISLASGGDEETSAAEAIARLMKKKRALRSPRGMGRLTELDRATVAETIEQIRVFEDGKVEITYTFSDDLGVLEK